MKVGRSEGQNKTNTIIQRNRETDRLAEGRTERERMDAYARLSRFPTERVGAVQGGAGRLIGVNCCVAIVIMIAIRFDWNWRQRSGSSRKERCLARAYGATSQLKSRPTTGLTGWPRRRSSVLGPPGCLVDVGGRGEGCHIFCSIPIHRGLAEPAGAEYSYTYSVFT